MREYVRNVAIVGSCLYGGILCIGFFVLLLLDSGAALYKRYSLRTATFLVFSFCFSPTVLFAGAVVPWIGAVYDSSTAAIVLVVVPGCLFALFLVAWFCLASNESMYHGNRYFLEDELEAEGAHTIDLDQLRRQSYLGSPRMESHAAAMTMSNEMPWRGVRTASPPLVSEWLKGPAQLYAPTLPSAVPQYGVESSPPLGASPASPLEYARRQQYIAGQLAQAEAVAAESARERRSPRTQMGGAPQPSRASISAGSLYTSALPASRSASASAPLAVSRSQQQRPYTHVTTHLSLESPEPTGGDARDTYKQRRASPGLAAPPPMPLQDDASHLFRNLGWSPPTLAERRQEEHAPATRQTLLTRGRLMSPAPRSPPSSATVGAIPPPQTRTSPQEVFLDVPFASELRG